MWERDVRVRKGFHLATPPFAPCVSFLVIKPLYMGRWSKLKLSDWMGLDDEGERQ